MQMLVVLLTITCLLFGGMGWIVAAVTRRYADRWSHFLLYIALAAALFPVFGHYYGTRDAGPRAITYMREHPEHYSEQEIEGVQSALNHFTVEVLLWLLGLYIAGCVLSRWRMWAGTFLPAIAFVGYYHVFHSELTDLLLRHGSGDVLVIVDPDNMGMIWAFILSAGMQVGLLAYAWTVSRSGGRP
jgi:hypothetical protein